MGSFHPVMTVTAVFQRTDCKLWFQFVPLFTWLIATVSLGPVEFREPLTSNRRLSVRLWQTLKRAIRDPRIAARSRRPHADCLIFAAAFPGWISGFPPGVCAQEPLCGRQHWVPIIQQVHLWPSRRSCPLERGSHPLQGGPRRRAGHQEDPRHTSQRRNRWGRWERGNRPRHTHFRCRACGCRVHADPNAARNLAARVTCSSGAAGVTPGLKAGKGWSSDRPR